MRMEMCVSLLKALLIKSKLNKNQSSGKRKCIRILFGVAYARKSVYKSCRKCIGCYSHAEGLLLCRRGFVCM